MKNFKERNTNLPTHVSTMYIDGLNDAFKFIKDIKKHPNGTMMYKLEIPKYILDDHNLYDKLSYITVYKMVYTYDMISIVIQYIEDFIDVGISIKIDAAQWEFDHIYDRLYRSVNDNELDGFELLSKLVFTHNSDTNEFAIIYDNELFIFRITDFWKDYETFSEYNKKGMLEHINYLDDGVIFTSGLENHGWSDREITLIRELTRDEFLSRYIEVDEDDDTDSDISTKCIDDELL